MKPEYYIRKRTFNFFDFRPGSKWLKNDPYIVCSFLDWCWILIANFKGYIFPDILYNYDCPGTNQMSSNLFTPSKSMKLVPGLWPSKLSGSDWQFFCCSVF